MMLPKTRPGSERAIWLALGLLVLQFVLSACGGAGSEEAPSTPRPTATATPRVPVDRERSQALLEFLKARSAGKAWAAALTNVEVRDATADIVTQLRFAPENREPARELCGLALDSGQAPLQLVYVVGPTGILTSCRPP